MYPSQDTRILAKQCWKSIGRARLNVQQSHSTPNTSEIFIKGNTSPPKKSSVASLLLTSWLYPLGRTQLLNKLLPHPSFFGEVDLIALLQRSFISSSPCDTLPAPSLCSVMADGTPKAAVKNTPIACAVPLREGLTLPWPYLERKWYHTGVTSSWR